MKDFFKYVLASILGLLVTGIIFIIVGIVSVAGFIASTASESETTVRDNSVFVLRLEGNVVERYASSPWDAFLSNDLTTTRGLEDILASIRKAKENDKIKGIYLEAGSFSCAPASAQSIRNALLDFKESGKFIIAYGGTYLQNTYYLASVADKLIVNPSGNIGWHGLSSQTVFYKGLLDKVGIEMQVFRVGTYKSAVEPFISTEMSPANRQQIQAFVGSIWGQMVADVSASRKLSQEQLNQLADRNMDFEPATAYVQNGLADTLLYKDQVLDYLKERMGLEADDDLHTLDLDEMMGVQRNVPKDMSGNIIAVYYAFGEIDNGSSDVYNDEGINSEKVIKDLRKLRKDENVKAVVLRVNSPGGSAYGSEQIWREVCLLKAEKPVIVSMGDYAASGGYYISCAADWIVAEPTTLTGSIGIFGMIPNAHGLLTDKLGLRMETVKTNQLADLGDLSRPFTEEEKAIVQNMVNQGYELFTRRCAEGRHMPQDSIKQIAEGRVWTGEAAKQLKLVDELGGIDKAIALAVERAEVEHYSIVSYPSNKNTFDKLFDLKAERYIHARLQDTFDEYYNGFLLLKHLKDADRMQARLPFDISLK